MPATYAGGSPGSGERPATVWARAPPLTLRRCDEVMQRSFPQRVNSLCSKMLCLQSTFWCQKYFALTVS